MKLKRFERRNIIIKILTKISFLINVLIMWFFIYSHGSEIDYVKFGILSIIMIVIGGIFDIYHDIPHFLETSGTILDYMGMLFLCGICAYFTYYEADIIGAISIIIAMIIETIITVAIFLCYKV